MDGRQFRRLSAFGCLLAAALGCNRNSVQSPVGPLPTTNGQPTIGVPMPSLGGKPASAPTVTSNEAMVPVSNKPASADALAAFADVRVDAAFDEKTEPGSKEQLLDSARKTYQKALEQEPKNKAAMCGMARFYARLGEREKAIEMYKKYLTIHTKDADVAHEVAVAHARWKDWDGAVAWCNFTLKIDPENRAAKKTLGFCLARAGKWDEAFTALCQIMPEAQARYNLARVLEHLNMGTASQAQLHLALKADPNFTAAREFLTELDAMLAGATQNPLRQAGNTEEPAP